MDDVRLQQLLQEAEEHLRARSCRQRYERAVVRPVSYTHLTLPTTPYV